ncbi:MAG TPA: hypothetical protein VIW29_20195 [Polyangiaceae bacterium]
MSSGAVSPAWLGALAALASLACSSALAERDGVCREDATFDCRVSPMRGAEPIDVGLVGYGCSGSERPDRDARYEERIPMGKVCAERGATAEGLRGFCCTASTTSCAYDPVAACEGGAGYRCRGADRPEALNAAISCGNGVRRDIYIDYCCTGPEPPEPCIQVNTIGCSERLTGFSCPGAALPRGEELPASESRADYYRLLCPMPTPASNVTRSNYCCYMPALIPPGASCVQNTHVPGCAAGRFGFACYGPDTPNQDYAPMSCPEPGFAGESAEGYPATLYCCDFR